jgi:glycine hydroxymethyltransferase
MDDNDLAGHLRESLAQQERELRSSLILNPVENIPFAEDLAVVSSTLHGLYTTDKVRSRDQRIDTAMQFAGRISMEADSRQIYEAWADALSAADVSMRALSGLHAHVVLFMALARPGQRILLLPVEAGGHTSGRAIMERLGLKVIDMVVDTEAMCVDIEGTLARCGSTPPDFVFVDRSEGLVVEDLSPLAAIDGATAIFDGSQYLTNIICGDHPNPFARGFDLLVSSVHKNFPGPQKALFATALVDDRWRALLSGASTFVSNMHATSTYAAGLTLARRQWLSEYSRAMLAAAVRLEHELAELGVPVIRRRTDRTPTHHVWIAENERERAFATYEALESCRILTNYRLLPYSLGHGIRIGLSAATRVGLREADTPRLAEIIAAARSRGAAPALRSEAEVFNKMIWSRLRAQV